MTINEKVRDEKLQFYVNREAAEMSALSQAKFISMSIFRYKSNDRTN